MAEKHAKPLTDIKFVTIHHTATGLAQNINDLKSQANAIERYHKDKAIANSWSAKTDGEYGYYWIEYHYLIAQDGSYLQVQDIKYQRIHAGDYSKGLESHNQHGVAICLVGNFETDIPSEKSLQTAGWLIHESEDKIRKEVKVKGHKDVSIPATACPGKNLHSKIKSIINYANNPVIPTEPLPTDCEEVRKKLEEVTRANESMRKTIEELNLEASSLKEQLKSEGKDLIDALEKNKKLNYELEDLKITVEKKTQQMDLLNKQLDDVDNQKQSILVELGKCSSKLEKLENEALTPQDKHYKTLYEDLRKKYDMLSEKVEPMTTNELLRELFRRVFNKS